MPALPLLLLTLLPQDPPATRPAVTLHSGALGAVVGLDGEVRGLFGRDGAASFVATASIGLPGAGWQELRRLELTPRFEEDSEILLWSHALVNLRIALPRGSDVLLCALQFPRPTRVRFALRADAEAGVDFALDVPSRPVETDGKSVARETDPVSAARVVLVRDPVPETRQRTLARAAAGAEGILEWAQSDGPAWLSAGTRIQTPEPDLDQLHRLSLLQLRQAEAGATAEQTLDVATRTRAACALALAGHAPEAARLLAVPASPRDALSAARMLTATRVTLAVCSDAALRVRLGEAARELAAGLLAFGTAEPSASQGAAESRAHPAHATSSPARSEVLDGLAAAAATLAETRPGEFAALGTRLLSLRARLRDEAWRPELSRLVRSPTAAGADAELLGLATSALLLPGSGALSPFDERIEATVARVLERLLSAEGLLGSSGEWRAESTFTPGSPHPAVAATCRFIARRLQLGDVEGARRTLMALVRKAASPAAHPLRLLPEGWHQSTGAALGDPSPAAAAEYALTAMLFLVGAQPPPDPRKADLLIAPSFPEDWKVSRVVNCPDPLGTFDLDLLREAQGVRLRLTRRRGEAVRILVRAWKTLATTADTLVELQPGKPAELLLPPPLRPTFRIQPGEPIIVPSAPAELRQRILGWVEAERTLAGRDLTKDLQRQDAPFDGDAAAYSAAVEALRRQTEARFEARRAAGR